jgi:protocatechuate 3,4-dioxygenase beta subunit
MTLRQSLHFLSPALFIFVLFQLPALADNKPAKTPSDHEGPFYPLVRQQDEDNDLIHVAGRDQAARGEILYLTGSVVDEKGRPFTSAVVEIWQTDPGGRYNDQRDRSPGPRDPDFQYWGKAVTGADGGFSFITLVPGAYHPRPAHIHCKVWVDGQARLTSQIYFRSTDLPEKAGGAQPSAAQELQTVDLRPTKAGEYEAFFQIVLSDPAD